MVPCASLPWPMNPLQGSGVSERSRCGAVRILAVADEPSTGIGRVGALAKLGLPGGAVRNDRLGGGWGSRGWSADGLDLCKIVRKIC